MRQNLDRLQLQQWSFDAGADADDDNDGGGDAKGIEGTDSIGEQRRRKQKLSQIKEGL